MEFKRSSLKGQKKYSLKKNEKPHLVFFKARDDRWREQQQP
jgi:hypothetical protein